MIRYVKVACLAYLEPLAGGRKVELAEVEVACGELEVGVTSHTGSDGDLRKVEEIDRNRDG